MDITDLLSEPFFVGFMVCALGAAALVWRTMASKRPVDAEEPDYAGQVRIHAAEGDFRRAASVQYKHGNKVEAFNLLARGGHHRAASRLAEELGQLKWAAKHAEQAMSFKRAGDLYAMCGDFGMAGRLYQRVGAFRRAAKVLEKDPETDIEVLAKLWQKACLKASSEARPGEEQGRKVVVYCARKAAEAYMHAGNNERAAFFFQMCGMNEAAQALRRQSQLFPKIPPQMTHDNFGSALIDLKAIEGFAGNHTGPFTPQSTPYSPAGPSTREHFRPPGAGLPAPSRRQRLTYVPSTNEHAAIPAQDHAPPPARAPAEAPGYEPQAPQAEAPREVVRVKDALTGEETSFARHSGRYVMGDALGSGRVASVVKAFDNTLKRPVALKFFPNQLSENPEAMAFFEREVRVAAAVMHKNLVGIQNYGVLEGRPFVAMEYVDGETLEARLHEWLRNGWGMPVEEVVRVTRGALSALAAVHQRGLVHRDVKPGNLMVTKANEIKLMDIGILRATDPARNRGPGITCYLASEQLSGEQGDHRADLFALGVTLYELLCGRLPFETEHRATMPKPVRYYRPDAPEVLDDLVWRCLLPEADARPSSASELLRRLEDLAFDESEDDEVIIEDLEPIDEEEAQEQAIAFDEALTRSLDESLRDYIESESSMPARGESKIIPMRSVGSTLHRLHDMSTIGSTPSLDSAQG